MTINNEYPVSQFLKKNWMIFFRVIYYTGCFFILPLFEVSYLPLKLSDFKKLRDF